MEAKVAVHPPDSWGSGEVRYDQPEKVDLRYIYGSSCQKEPRAVDTKRAAGKVQMKTSRSYDNELQTSINRDADLRSKAESGNVRDDLSLSYAGRRLRQPQKASSTQRSLPQASSSSSSTAVAAAASSVIRERPRSKSRGENVMRDVGKGSKHTEGNVSRDGQKKWTPREKSPGKKTPRMRQRYAAEERAENVSSEIHLPVSSHQWSIPRRVAERDIPVEFHLTEDQQSKLKHGPKQQQLKRPSTLSSPSSSSSSREKPAPMVILEVKDGPTLFYKPSDRMVSDSRVGDDSSQLPLHSSFGAYAGHSAANTSSVIASKELTSVDYKASGRPGGAPLTSTPLSKETKLPVSHLPRTPALRKPDLSALTSPKREKKVSSRPDTGASICASGSSPSSACVQNGSKGPSADRAQMVIPTMPSLPTELPSSSKTLYSSSSAQSEKGKTKDISGSTFRDDPVSTFQSERDEMKDRNVSSVCDELVAGTSTMVTSTPKSTNLLEASVPVPAPGVTLSSKNESSSDASGFLNTSEIMQQKAGIRHDDIVVGPRKHRSVPHDEIVVGPRRDVTSVRYDDFIGSELAMEQAHSQSKPLAATSDVAEPSSSVDTDPRQQPHTPQIRNTASHSGTTLTGMPVSKGSPKRKSSSVDPEPVSYIQPVRTDTFGYQDIPSEVSKSILDTSGESTSFMSTGTPAVAWTGDDGSAVDRRRPREKRSGLHKLRKGKREGNISTESGYMTDVTKQEIPNVSPKVQSDSSSVHSHDTWPSGHTHKHTRETRSGSASGETRPKSKSASSSPAKQQKQQQQQSSGDKHPKTRSAISVPTKKPSKLHMLSNIPIPISHDPPAKKPTTYTSKTTAPEENETPSGIPAAPGQAQATITQTTMSTKLTSAEQTPKKKKKISEKTSASEQDSALENSAFSSETNMASLSSAPHFALQAKPLVKTSVLTVVESGGPDGIQKQEMTTKSRLQECEKGRVPSSGKAIGRAGAAIANGKGPHDSTTTSVPRSEDIIMQAASSPQQSAAVHVPKPVCQQPATASSIADQPSTKLLPSTVTNSEQNLTKQLPCDSPLPTPLKPRLHRSAEHLFGDAKLSIFNSIENIQHADNSEVTAANARKALQEMAKGEQPGVDQVSPLKKSRGLAKIGILRRGSDRTDMGRRGSERAVPISRNDPSVEDLKKATSLKELCQSVASLLNIDNEKAAEMLTTSLSQRQDLVEGLDADAILDYLSHHGVLDPAILVGLDEDVSPTQRNSTILKHVEEHGNTAVALFINALRQSGQLHLASSLDTEQRIKPVSGDGYFGKQRHKGEVTIRLEIEALKILAPREPRLDKIVDTSLLATPEHHTGNTPIVEEVVDDEDAVKPSCWCFCFSRKGRAKSSSSASKKDAGKSQRSEARRPTSLDEVERRNPNSNPHRTKSKEKTKAGKGNPQDNPQFGDRSKGGKKDSGKKSKASKSKSSGKYSVPAGGNDQPSGLGSVPEVAFRSGKEEVVIQESSFSKNRGQGAGQPPSQRQQPQPPPSSSSTHAPFPHQQQSQPHNGVVDTSPSDSLAHSPKPNKENWEPIIMEYDPKLELIKLRAGQEELASPTRQAGNIGIMCEQWKSSGRHFLQKASQLCDRIIHQFHTEIIKYFEQDRGTLVLDVVSDGSAVLIVNICMLRAQVKRLKQESEDETLLQRLQELFLSKVDVSVFDIRGVKYRVVLNDQQVSSALTELS